MRTLRRNSGARLNDAGTDIFPVQVGDKTHADTFGTDRLALVLIATRAESFPIHRFHHRDDAMRPFRFSLGESGQMRDLSGKK